jgi:hypothetical protein
MLWSRIRCATLVGAGLVATASTASAHHLMGGKTPSTFTDGILSASVTRLLGQTIWHSWSLLALRSVSAGLA